MKRVAIFASAFHPSLGGVEELVRQLVLQFREEGHNAVVCTNQWPRNLKQREVIDGVPVWRFPFRIPWGGVRSKVRFPFTVNRTVEGLCSDLRQWRAEVIHVQCVSSNGWYAREAARILGLPLIISTQGERTMDATGVYQRSPLFNRVLRDCLARAQIITGCSKATLEDLEHYHGRSFGERGRVIYNGVGQESFEEGPSWPHPSPYLLALGRMVPQKGFAELLKAFSLSHLRGVDLLLGGDGPELLALKTLSATLGIGDRVHFLGRACRRTVGELLRGCRGLVVPSLREPMGIVALEGMAGGKPLVVSRVDGLCEVALEGIGCRQVGVGDVAELAGALEWLGTSAGRTVPENRQRALKFQWRKIGHQYLAAYEEAQRMMGDDGKVALSGLRLAS